MGQLLTGTTSAYTPRVVTARRNGNPARVKKTPWLRAVGARFRELRHKRRQDSFKSLKVAQVGRFEQGFGVHLSALEGLCNELGVHPSRVFVPGALQESSESIQRSPTSSTQTGEGSLVNPVNPVHAGGPTPEEGAPMPTNPFGLAVLGLMTGFTAEQHQALHDAATAIAKGGRNHAPKEGLPT